MPTALVTGGAKRIGRAIARRLAADGHDIAIHVHQSRDEGEALAKELRDLGRRAAVVAGDLSDPAVAEQVYDAAEEALGRLHVVVNNASIFPKRRLEDMSWEEVAESEALHAWSPFVLTRRLSRHGGCVVNLLDSRVVDHDLAHVPYFLGKRTLLDLTRICAIRFAPGLRVNAVAPGPVLPPPGQPDDAIQYLAKVVPLKRLGEPEEVADAVAFLVQARYTTGQVLFVDGGRHLKKPAT